MDPRRGRRHDLARRRAAEEAAFPTGGHGHLDAVGAEVGHARFSCCSASGRSVLGQRVEARVAGLGCRRRAGRDRRAPRASPRRSACRARPPLSCPCRSSMPASASAVCSSDCTWVPLVGRALADHLARLPVDQHEERRHRHVVVGPRRARHHDRDRSGARRLMLEMLSSRGVLAHASPGGRRRGSRPDRRRGRRPRTRCTEPHPLDRNASSVRCWCPRSRCSPRRARGWCRRRRPRHATGASAPRRERTTGAPTGVVTPAPSSCGAGPCRPRARAARAGSPRGCAAGRRPASASSASTTASSTTRTAIGRRLANRRDRSQAHSAASRATGASQMPMRWASSSRW